jgi:UDP-N-acetylglucosamine--N-acetylmuramyl-(pentapeptide) pyrophosphoryl-undecaprenol N-acetylglucosamine transferase
VILTGGGTGGHLYPAISIARALVELGCGAPGFIGSRTGLEAEVVPREGFAFHAIASRKVSRVVTPAAALSLASIAWGTVQAGMLLRRRRPLAVIGTGGYASAGVVLAAAFQGIPTLIHEQNSIPGRTNRLLARIVRRVAVTFPESTSYFPEGKSVLTGLPIRPEIISGDRRQAEERFGLETDRRTLLVLGGSLGARSLNRAVREALPLWANSGLQVIHQVGNRNWEEHQAALRSAPAWYHPVAFLTDMGDAYAAADLVLCRAGASTLAELWAVGLPSLLVPYPYAHADHQSANARSAVTAGAATLLPDQELSGPRLVSEVGALFDDPPTRDKMAVASRALGRPDAARELLQVVWEMVGRPAGTMPGHLEQGAKRGAA